VNIKGQEQQTQLNLNDIMSTESSSIVSNEQAHFFAIAPSKSIDH